MVRLNNDMTARPDLQSQTDVEKTARSTGQGVSGCLVKNVICILSHLDVMTDIISWLGKPFQSNQIQRKHWKFTIVSKIYTCGKICLNHTEGSDRN